MLLLEDNKNGHKNAEGDVEFHVLTPNKIKLLHVVIHKAFVQFLVALRQLVCKSDDIVAFPLLLDLHFIFLVFANSVVKIRKQSNDLKCYSKTSRGVSIMARWKIRNYW